MGHVGKTVTQNVVSGSEITDGTVTGDDLASDIAISTSGAITTTGAFTSQGIDDNADATAITITSDEAVGVGTSLTPNNYSGYQVLTIGGSNATTGSAFDLEDSSGNIEAEISGTAGRLYLDADPNGATASSFIHLGVDGSQKAKIENNGKFSVFGDSSANIILFQNADSSPYGQSIYFSNASPNNTTNWFLSCADNSSQNFIVFSNGDVKNDNGVYTSFSDERLKTNIVDAKSQWEDIKDLKFKNFIKFSNPDLKQLGLIAQDVEKTSPNLVFETPPNKYEIKYNSAFGTLYEEGDELPEGKEVGDVKEVKSNVKNIKDSILYMKSVKALQEAMERIEKLETSNADLIKRIEALEEA